MMRNDGFLLSEEMSCGEEEGAWGGIARGRWEGVLLRVKALRGKR